MHKKTILIILLVLMLALITGCNKGENPQNTQQQQQPGSTRVASKGGEYVPFTIPELSGGTINLADYEGKVLFLNFWATYCGPCKMEIPSFVKLVDKYGKDGFAIVGISLDRNVPKENLLQFGKRYGVNYPMAWIGDNPGIMQQYRGITAIPTTYVIDRDGIIQDVIVGALPESEFESIIKKHLGNSV